MMRRLDIWMAAALLAVCTGTVRAQQPAAAAPAPPRPAVTLRVDVVISRYLAEKKISSLPYSLIVNADAADKAGVPEIMQNSMFQRTSLRNGVNVTRYIGDKFETVFVGTNIDCSAMTLSDGRYRLMVSIQDSSIYAPDGASAVPPSNTSSEFRDFSVQNTLLVRDGQSMLFASGTDKISGETTKVDVTATAVK